MRVHEFMAPQGIRWPPSPLAQDPGPVILRSVAWVERDQAEPTINMQIDDSRGRLVLCLLVPAAKKAAYRRLYAALQGAVDRSLAEIEDTKLPPLSP